MSTDGIPKVLRIELCGHMSYAMQSRLAQSDTAMLATRRCGGSIARFRRVLVHTLPLPAKAMAVHQQSDVLTSISHEAKRRIAWSDMVI